MQAVRSLALSVGLLWIATVTMAATPKGGGHWPQWRGPERNGISTESGLIERWPSKGPRLIWKANRAGEGYSTVSIADGRIFTMGNRGDVEYVICYDEATGRELWSQRNGEAYSNGRGGGPRGTPTVDGRWVYSLGGSGDLSCRDVRTGRAKWHVNLIRDLGGRQIHWGLSESVLIDGEKLICTPGGRDAGVAALDKNTGRLIWKSGRDRAGYSSPIVAEIGGVRQVIVFTSEAAQGLAIADGKELWTYDEANNRTANVATPIVHEDRVFVSSDYGTGAGLVKLSPAGSRVRADEVYFTRDMRNHHCTSVLIGDYLYGFSGSVLTCMEFDTGKVAWKNRSVGKGSLVYADGHLYCLSENNVMGLVEATPEGYREKGRFRLPKGRQRTWAHPVVAGGRLYLRDQDTIYCYDVKAR